MTSHADTGDETLRQADEEQWRIFRGDGLRRPGTSLPEAPPWRRFTLTETPSSGEDDKTNRHGYVIGAPEAEVINAALHLRRPLLVTGNPGVGKTSLAKAIAHELDLGEVLHWPINSRSTLQDALYRYDAIGRLQESNLPSSKGKTPPIGRFVRLGPLGTALVPSAKPRVLLIDELDKGDVDLPNDLLTTFEDGKFEIPELSRLPAEQRKVKVNTADHAGHAMVKNGHITCTQFPVVVITSNGERDFPPAFLRRCLPLHMADPEEKKLREIITKHLGESALVDVDDLVTMFCDKKSHEQLATDQLLNAVFLRMGGHRLDDPDGLLRTVLHRLNAGG